MTHKLLIFSLITGGIIYTLGGIIIKNLNKRKMQPQVKDETESNKTDCSKAKDSLVIKKLGIAMKIERDTIKLADTPEIKQGDRVSFNTFKYGFITGEFVGVKTAMCSGYSEVLIVRLDERKILQAPIEYIDVDTINVYGR